MALRRWGEVQNRSIRQGGENRHDIDLIFLSEIYREAANLPDMRVSGFFVVWRHRIAVLIFEVSSMVAISAPAYLRPKTNKLPGYIAGILAGVSYGLNPLFGIPLLTTEHMSVDSVLFYRYAFAVVILGGFLVARKVSLRVMGKQFGFLALLGFFFAMSSLLLFEAYNFVPSGIATTLVFLYPVLVAFIMVFLRVFPTWQVWVSIGLTFLGVIMLCHTDSTATYRPIGYVLAALSALSYAFFIVVVNRSKTVKAVSNTVLTFYALLVGAAIFFVHAVFNDAMMLPPSTAIWNLLGLALLPTIVSTGALACATRFIGPTKASVLGVTEPMTAIAVGVAVMGEPINSWIVMGVILTMVAIVFMTVSDKPKSIAS